MGLDGVELVMAIEEEFDISITDLHAEGLATVGDMIDHVHAAVNGLDPAQERIEWAKVCADFEKSTGKAIVGLPHRTKIVELLDRHREVEQWEAVDALPCPVLPSRLRAVRAVALITALVAPSVQWGISPGSAVLGLVLVMIAWLVLERLFLGNRVIPDRGLTLESLVWWREPKAGEDTSRGTIAANVREIVVEQLGVNPEQVTEDARFIDDLGVG